MKLKFTLREAMVKPMKTVRRPSVAPVYSVAAVWLLYTLLFGLHSVPQLLLCAAISAGVFLLMKAAFPGKVVQVEVPETPPDTGDAELDEVILQGRDAVRRIRKFNDDIPDKVLSASLLDLESTIAKIFQQLAADKRQVKRCRQFLNYYLPTPLRLLERYVQLQSLGMDRGSDVSEAMDKIRRSIAMIQKAFRKLLDSLFAPDLVDINAEISVMEQMLKSQGLTGQDDFTDEGETTDG